MKKFIQASIVLMLAGCPVFSSRADLIGVNLLANSDSSSSDLSGWTVTANGGSGWAVHSGVFTTSYDWDIRSQTVDLLSNGFTPAELDGAPLINAGVWENTYWGGSFFLNIVLQDANHNQITSYNLGSQASPVVVPVADPCDTNFYWVGTTFSNYAPGVRYVVYTDGGKDTRYWGGNYGTAFEGASVAVAAIPEPHILALLPLALAIIWYSRRHGRLR